MASQVSQHLWNAALLALSASVALAAERFSAPAQHTSGGALAGSDVVERFMTPAAESVTPVANRIPISVDPFGARAARLPENVVASSNEFPTVSTSSGGRTSPRLTAILVTDDRRLAVIDDAAVSVGDVLPDGSRVSAIHADKVFVVEKNGRWRMLTLTNRGR